MKPLRLYRPVGRIEFELIRASGWKKFPPRLSHQPIFYPVCNSGYAIQIARDWNTKDKENGSVGIVLYWDMPYSYMNQFKKRIVGSANHEEYWVPAEKLEEFNQNIVGNSIYIEDVYFGD